jgi:hypothetical protein
MHNNTDIVLSIILYYTVLYQKKYWKYSSIIEKYSILRALTRFQLLVIGCDYMRRPEVDNSRCE